MIGGITQAGIKQAEANKAEFHAKKREELYQQELEKGYANTGGLPANLRYPYAMIDSGMDFLKIQIATYTPPKIELEGLLDVNNKDKKDTTGAKAKIK